MLREKGGDNRSCKSTMPLQQPLVPRSVLLLTSWSAQSPGSQRLGPHSLPETSLLLDLVIRKLFLSPQSIITVQSWHIKWKVRLREKICVCMQECSCLCVLCCVGRCQCVCVCACMPVYVCVCLDVCAARVTVYAGMLVCVWVSLCACVGVDMHACVCACVCMPKFIHAISCISHTCIISHTHTHIIYIKQLQHFLTLIHVILCIYNYDQQLVLLLSYTYIYWIWSQAHKATMNKTLHSC